MGLFGRKEKRQLEITPEVSVTPEVSAELLRTLIGNDEITAEKALEIPAFSMAVDFISGTVAMLPVKLYRENKTAHTTEEITDDKRLFLLNDEANSTMGAADCRRAQIRDMLLFGSGFIFINQNQFGEITSLHYVKKSDVSIASNGDPIFREFNIYVGAHGYLPFNFIILARNSTDGVTGAGAVEEHKTLLSAAYLALKYEQAISKTGGNKKGFLLSERNLTRAAMDELKAAWRDIYANNEENLMILNNGIKYEPSASTSVEMQLNENKRTNAEQIAQIFGLSTNVLSGKCTTAEYMSTVRTAVLSVVEQVQAALNRSLLTEEEKGEFYFALDTSELLKGDTLSRYQAYEIALRNNFLQLDEVRYLEDKQPLGFDFMRLGLNDVLYDAKTKTIYTPNMNAITRLNGGLTNGELRDIMELRKKTNWVKGKKGLFAGSVPMGGGGAPKKDLTNPENDDIIDSGSDDVTISSIDSPIEQKHSGKGNPNAILIFDVELNNRQQALLKALPEYDSRITVPKKSVNMADLSALTAKTGDEFAMFTNKDKRLVIRGNEYKVNVTVAEATALADQGYRWSGHTHPGTDPNVKVPSQGDKEILKCFPQEFGVIYDSKGSYRTFEKE